MGKSTINGYPDLIDPIEHPLLWSSSGAPSFPGLEQRSSCKRLASKRATAHSAWLGVLATLEMGMVFPMDPLKMDGFFQWIH
jgi:hypothetical protein